MSTKKSTSASGDSQSEESSQGKYQVVVPFKDDPKYLAPGEEAVSYVAGGYLPADMDQERIEALLKRGIVKAN